jgi:long-subunit fatty acid transport protein
VPVLLAFALPSFAVTDEEIFREFRFNLLNPGARSLGLGGAFISIADDASAALANPAGMSLLTRPEFFGELRFVDNEDRSITRSETLPAGIETFVATGTNVADQGGFSFLSAVVPFRRWTLGLSLQEVLNISNTTLSSFAFTFPDSPGAFLANGAGSVDAQVRNFNASFGVAVTDRFRVGATLTYSRLDVESEVFNSVVDTGANIAAVEILEPTLDTLTRVDDDDSALAYSLGLMYKRVDKWGVGAVYRRGPRFTVIEQVIASEDADGDGQPDGLDLFGTTNRLGTEFENQFSLPDSFGIGGNYLLLQQRLTLAVNVERLIYSNLLDGYVPGVNILTSEDAEFDVGDATDYRFGTEYIWFNDKNALPPVALRGGAFVESDSTISASFTGSGGFATEEIFAGGENRPHLTLGLGISLKRWNIDMASDFSETDNEYLLSVIYRGK